MTIESQNFFHLLLVCTVLNLSIVCVWEKYEWIFGDSELSISTTCVLYKIRISCFSFKIKFNGFYAKEKSFYFELWAVVQLETDKH